MYFLFQAEEVGGRSNNYDRAVIDVSVLSTNEYDPVINTNTGTFRGQISEDADIGAFVRAEFGSRVLSLSVSDNDVVS